MDAPTDRLAADRAVPSPTDHSPTALDRLDRVVLGGLAAALALVALAMALPAVTGWNVHVRSFPPLHAEWAPRVGPGTLGAVAIAVLGARHAPALAERLTWRRLVVATFAAGLLWMLALALVDGRDGIGVILQTPYEYLRTARATDDLPATLREYTDRIPYSAAPDNWPVHIAGHPPGALTFFVVLVRLGLGGGLAAGLVVTVIAASTAPAVLVTLRRLGAEAAARRAAPLLTLGPAAIWQCVSADAMFAAVGAWGLAMLAFAATSTRRTPALGWAAGAGLLLGAAVMMSYGLPLLGVLALAVLFLGGSWRPLVPAAVAAAAVVLTYAAFGFAWWEGLHVLHGRYWDGVAHVRPPQYWMWGNLAALTVSAGPALGAVVAVAWARRREALGRAGDGGERRVVLVLVAAAAATVLLADVSQMSRAEVERIWLPFVPWLLVGAALVPEPWRRRLLVVQIGAALVVQHLLRTGW